MIPGKTFRSRTYNLPQDMLARAQLDEWFDDNEEGDYRWLDIGAGDGSYIRQVTEMIHSTRRARIELTCHEQHLDALNKCAGEAQRIGVKDFHRKLVELNNPAYAIEGSFDLITLINVVHELPRDAVPRVLLAALRALNEDGALIIWDVAELDYYELEPGAIPWSVTDAESILRRLLVAIGARHALTHSFATGRYKAPSGRSAWHAKLLRRHLPTDLDAHSRATGEPAERHIEQEIGLCYRSMMQHVSTEIAVKSQQYKDIESVNGPFWERSKPKGKAAQLIQNIDVLMRVHWGCACSTISVNDHTLPTVY